MCLPISLQLPQSNAHIFFLFCVFKLFKLMLNLCSIRDSGTQGRVTNTLKVKRFEIRVNQKRIINVNLKLIKGPKVLSK